MSKSKMRTLLDALSVDHTVALMDHQTEDSMKDLLTKNRVLLSKRWGVASGEFRDFTVTDLQDELRKHSVSTVFVQGDGNGRTDLDSPGIVWITWLHQGLAHTVALNLHNERDGVALD